VRKRRQAHRKEADITITQRASVPPWKPDAASMAIKLALALLVVVASTIEARAEGTTVTFPVVEASGNVVELRGKLNTPEGVGPFPAVVLLHGCDGLSPDAPWDDDHPFVDWGYDERPFLAWGYATLWVDSFGPRGVENVCDGEDRYIANPNTRVRDAFAGKAFLAGLPEIDVDRIGLIGWSHGGIAVLKAVSNATLHEPSPEDPFDAAVAFYPGCPFELHRLNAPLLILIGDADDWTPVTYCENMVLVGDTEFDVDLVVYPGATHAFEWSGASDGHGHKMEYDPDATADAFRRIEEFLALNMPSDGPGD